MNCAPVLMISSSSPAAISCAPSRVSPTPSARRTPGACATRVFPELTPTELLAVTAIAYLQPATRAQISQLAGREISRDVIGALKRHGLIDGSLRAPEPGAPFAYVTTKRFLEVFGLASLRHLPDIERLEEEGLLRRPQEDIDLDGALGISGMTTSFSRAPWSLTRRTRSSLRVSWRSSLSPHVHGAISRKWSPRRTFRQKPMRNGVIRTAK